MLASFVVCLSMDYREFKRLLGKAGTTNKEFAALMGLNPNSLSNYAKKDNVPSHLAIIATLLSEMAENQIDFRGVLNKIDVNPKKSRGLSIGQNNQIQN